MTHPMHPIRFSLSLKNATPEIYDDWPLDVRRSIRDVIVGEIDVVAIGADGQAYEYHVEGTLKGTMRRRTPTFPEHYLASVLDLARGWKGEPTTEQAVAVATLLRRAVAADEAGRLPGHEAYAGPGLARH